MTLLTVQALILSPEKQETRLHFKVKTDAVNLQTGHRKSLSGPEKYLEIRSGGE